MYTEKTGERRRLVLLGLSEFDWKQLREGVGVEGVIHLDLEIDDVRVLIVGGATDESMRAQLAEWFEIATEEAPG